MTTMMTTTTTAHSNDLVILFDECGMYIFNLSFGWFFVCVNNIPTIVLHMTLCLAWGNLYVLSLSVSSLICSLCERVFRCWAPSNDIQVMPCVSTSCVGCITFVIDLFDITEYNSIDKVKRYICIFAVAKFYIWCVYVHVVCFSHTYLFLLYIYVVCNQKRR